MMTFAIPLNDPNFLNSLRFILEMAKRIEQQQWEAWKANIEAEYLADGEQESSKVCRKDKRTRVIARVLQPSFVKSHYRVLYRVRAPISTSSEGIIIVFERCDMSRLPFLLFIWSSFLQFLAASPLSIIQTEYECSSRFILLERGCTCNKPPGAIYNLQGMIFSGPISSPGANVTNTTLGSFGHPDYNWTHYYTLESRAMAIDREAKRLYIELVYEGVDEPYQGAIFSYTYDGHNKTRILTKDASTQGGMQIASWNGEKKIYYSNGIMKWGVYGTKYGTGSSIRRANLDGSDIEVLVFPEGMNCTDLQICLPIGSLNNVAIDEEMGYLYWSSDQKTAIFRAPIDLKPNETATTRTDIEVLFSANLDFPGGLKFWNGALYWTIRYSYNGTHLNDVSQVWRWKSRYGDPIVGNEAEGEKECLVNSTTFHGFKALTFDVETNDMWLASETWGWLYRGNSDGEDMTEYELGLRITDTRGLEIVYSGITTQALTGFLPYFVIFVPVVYVPPYKLQKYLYPSMAVITVTSSGVLGWVIRANGGSPGKLVPPVIATSVLEGHFRIVQPLRCMEKLWGTLFSSSNMFSRINALYHIVIGGAIACQITATFVVTKLTCRGARHSHTTSHIHSCTTYIPTTSYSTSNQPQTQTRSPTSNFTQQVTPTYQALDLLRGAKKKFNNGDDDKRKPALKVEDSGEEYKRDSETARTGERA
ncbi:hypothetical protein G7Y89_g1165 [Cudoniella acicularis]|uniref:Uncharacterized protein n=1 Tax=Cudoniella acicularis TaxID=354080 RepID=A0A8H4RVU9_9HELO|nr:hypothetical protein G7Y89_g1165 [Cudoniella acicularis]